MRMRAMNSSQVQPPSPVGCGVRFFEYGILVPITNGTLPVQSRSDRSEPTAGWARR